MSGFEIKGGAAGRVAPPMRRQAEAPSPRQTKLLADKAKLTGELATLTAWTGPVKARRAEVTRQLATLQKELDGLAPRAKTPPPAVASEPKGREAGAKAAMDAAVQYLGIENGTGQFFDDKRQALGAQLKQANPADIASMLSQVRNRYKDDPAAVRSVETLVARAAAGQKIPGPPADTLAKAKDRLETARQSRALDSADPDDRAAAERAVDTALRQVRAFEAKAPKAPPPKELTPAERDEKRRKYEEARFK